jgi:HEAT repeat protein
MYNRMTTMVAKVLLVATVAVVLGCPWPAICEAERAPTKAAAGPASAPAQDQAEQLLARVLRNWRPGFEEAWMLLSSSLQEPIDKVAGSQFGGVAWRMGLLGRHLTRSAKDSADVQALVKFGASAAAACNRAIAAADPSTREAGILAALLAETGDRDSIPLLIDMLARSGKLQGNTHEQTYVACMLALWRLTGRELRKDSAGWKLWWQAVKDDFLLPADRAAARITAGRVTPLLAELGKPDDELIGERLIALGPNVLPYLLEELSRGKPDARHRLMWVIDELGKSDKMPREFRLAYFIKRLNAEKPDSEPGMAILRRALTRLSFDDFCRAAIQGPHYPGYERMDDLLPEVMKDNRGQVDAAVDILIQGVTDPNQAVRRRAAALARMIASFTDARPPKLVEALIKGWHMGPDDGYWVPWAMVRFDTPAVRAAIKEGLWSERVKIVIDSARMAGDSKLLLGPDRQMIGLRLVELTAHKSNGVRSAAACSLARRMPELLIPHLLRLCGDDVESVRTACAEAMGKLQNPDHGSLLVSLAFDKEMFTREAALKALGNPAFRGAIPGLVPLLKNPQNQYNVPAMWAIAKAGGAEAAAVLIQEASEGNTIIGGGTIYDALEKVTGKRFKTADEAVAWWWTFPMNQPPAKTVDLPESRLKSLWDSLGSGQLLEAHQAGKALVAGGRSTVAFMAATLEPVSADTKRIPALVADLDSREYAVRRKAFDELARIGAPAKAALTEALKTDPTAEARIRIQLLLKAASSAYPATPAATRTGRAVRVLEMIATDKAIQLLERLAQGMPGSYVTEQATAAIKRIQKPRRGQPASAPKSRP